MNMVDLERLKEKEDAAIKIIDSWPRIFHDNPIDRYFFHDLIELGHSRGGFQ